MRSLRTIPTKTSTVPKIFISHANADKPLADALFDLLQLACDLRVADIVCTSVDGAGISTGAEFANWIKANLADSALVVFVQTENFAASKFCIAEMGAAWALNKQIFPLMSPHVSRDPGVVFSGRQSSRLDSTGLDALRDTIVQLAPGSSSTTARWTIKKDAFIENLDALLESLPKPQTVSMTELQEQKQLTEAAKQLHRESELKLRDLVKQLSLVEALKDANEVDSIHAQFVLPLDAYEKLVSEARQRLSPLGRIEARALYAEIKNDPWYPTDYAWNTWGDSISKAVASEWIIQEELIGGETSLSANSEHPKLAKAFDTLHDLNEAILKLPAEAIKSLAQEHECLISITNRQYWDEILLNTPMLE